MQHSPLSGHGAQGVTVPSLKLDGGVQLGLLALRKAAVLVDADVLHNRTQVTHELVLQATDTHRRTAADLSELLLNIVQTLLLVNTPTTMSCRAAASTLLSVPRRATHRRRRRRAWAVVLGTALSWGERRNDFRLNVHAVQRPKRSHD